MGCVYAGQGVESKHFKIGQTIELGKRRAQHRTSHPSFAIYRAFQTTNPRAAEEFLKKWFAAKRVPSTTEWFAITKKEVDEGFLALDVYMQTHLSVTQEKEVKAFAKRKSNGLFLPADDTHNAIYETCRKLKIEIRMRELEYEHWIDQLKHQIGCNDGIEGLFTWISSPKHLIDQATLKRDYPDVWTACRTEITERKFYLLDGAEEKD